MQRADFCPQAAESRPVRGPPHVEASLRATGATPGRAGGHEAATPCVGRCCRDTGRRLAMLLTPPAPAAAAAAARAVRAAAPIASARWRLACCACPETGPGKASNLRAGEQPWPCLEAPKRGARARRELHRASSTWPPALTKRRLPLVPAALEARPAAAAARHGHQGARCAHSGPVQGTLPASLQRTPLGTGSRPPRPGLAPCKAAVGRVALRLTPRPHAGLRRRSRPQRTGWPGGACRRSRSAACSSLACLGQRAASQRHLHTSAGAVRHQVAASRPLRVL